MVLSDMCHSTMGSSSADVLRSLDLASCAAELAVGPLEPQLHPQGLQQQQVHSSDGWAAEEEAVGSTLQSSSQEAGLSGVLLPQGHLVMKLLQVRYLLAHLRRQQNLQCQVWLACCLHISCL